MRSKSGEITHIRRPTRSEDRTGKKKSACFVRSRRPIRDAQDAPRKSIRHAQDANDGRGSEKKTRVQKLEKTERQE